MIWWWPLSSSSSSSSSSRHPLLLLHIFIILPFLLFGSPSVMASGKFNQRIFLSVKAIHYVDPTKNGFRVILRDEFLRLHMAPTMLPTLFLTAIPLSQSSASSSSSSSSPAGRPEESSNGLAQTKIFYPDSVNEEKQVVINELRESAWYYICVEWENFNRHNETTGTDCRLFRTLDRFGKGADSVVQEVEATDFSSQMLQFRIRAGADFPIRLTASLEGGSAPMPQSVVFMLSANSNGHPSELDLIFPFLRQQKDYGQLCLLEEPLVIGFSAMGRLVAGVSIRKCHFNNLTTTDYELSILETAEASPYMRGANSAEGTGRSAKQNHQTMAFAIIAMLTTIWWLTGSPKQSQQQQQPQQSQIIDAKWSRRRRRKGSQ